MGSDTGTGDRAAAVVVEPAIPFANELLETVRDVRRRIGREAKPVWLPPESYCAVLATADLPERARDEVVAMGLAAAAGDLDAFELKLDPPVLERLGDGSMLVVCRAWSDSASISGIGARVVAGLESVGLEPRLETDASGGLRFVLGWIPGPTSLESIPGEPSGPMPTGTTVDRLMAGLPVKVGETPMSACRRIRTVPFGGQCR